MSEKLDLKTYTKTLESLIKNYKMKGDSSEVGVVLSNADGVFNISGVRQAQSNEVLIIDDKYLAIALILRADCIGAISLHDFTKISDGMTVKRTYEIFSVQVGDELLGRIVNAMGESVDGLGKLKSTIKMPIEAPAPSVINRQSVSEPLNTGIFLIDSLIPVGKGQRELIIGDRQTGKTSIGLGAILNQKGKNCYCIYVAIGQKNSTLNQVVRKLRNCGALEYTTVVASSSSDLPALKFIAPFSATTIAEYWMQQGKDVLIVYDDLSQHAVSYRTISLLLDMPPGREAYPGDIFYLHSRLLERSGRLTKKCGGGSITSLPIIETQEGDISSYIPTNVISITDGQIFLKTSLFNSGQRPAIDLNMSVSRVGGAAQYPIHKELSGSLKLQLSNYNELVEFSQFGSDLSEHNQQIINSGARTMKTLVQPQNVSYSPEDQFLILYLIFKKHLIGLPTHAINDFVDQALISFKALSIYKEFPLQSKLKNIDTSTIDKMIKNVLKGFKLQHK